jgi:hypothetical protein
MDTVQLYHEFLNLMESCDYEVQEVHEPEVHRLDQHGHGVHGIYDVYGESEKRERSIHSHSLIYSSPNKSFYTSSQPSPHESFDISRQPRHRERQHSRINSQTNLQSRTSNSSLSSLSSNSQSSNLQSSNSRTSSLQSSSLSQSQISNVETKSIQSPRPLHRPYKNISRFSASNLTGYPSLPLSPCQTYLNSSYLKSPLNSPCNSCLNTSLIELTGLVNSETDIIDDDEDDLYYSGDSDSDSNAVLLGLFPSMDIDRDFLTFEELPMNPSYVT